MEKSKYRYRFWYRYRRKFMVSDWYRIETKKAGIAHHYASLICTLTQMVKINGNVAILA